MDGPKPMEEEPVDWDIVEEPMDLVDDPKLMERDLEPEVASEEDNSDDGSSGMDTELEFVESEPESSESSFELSGSNPNWVS